MARLRAAIAKARVDAILVTHLPNVRYLCGFTGSAGVLLAGSRNFFFTDARYAEQAEKEVVGAKVVVATAAALIAASRQAARIKRGRLGVEADHLSLSAYDAIADALPKGVRLAATRSVVEQLRMLKEAAEIERIRSAVELGCNLLPTAQAAIRPGVQETEVAAKIEFAARKSGARSMSFETIVASGPRSALPHGVASDARVPTGGFVVLDYGVILHGYCSDMTRTVHVGRADQEEQDLYRAVLDAHTAAIKACAPGVKLAEIDATARHVLKKAKLDKFFTHSTGHGVGLEIHELPRVARGQKEVLQPGMVITIEPGVYQAGKRGIRIEDMVAITETGYELLTSARKELIEI
ncbi:MAG TPA: Xaa-Pro peptidase family protein [Terriglobales bacterium]|nr:Xaa-Pro peptidase family protein [Terriglobales bacterium]